MATIKKAEIVITDNVITLTTETGDFHLDADTVTDAIATQAMMHGFKQKICDSYAGLKTSHEIDGAIKTVINSLVSGTWNAGRSSLGGVWVEALARATGADMDAVVAKWNGMDDEEKKGVKAHPQVKQAKAEIELERAQRKAEGSTLDLDEI